MAKISPFGKYQAFDSDGAPLSGGKLNTYEAGTSTPKVTYTDKDAGTANTNPVILDANGYADVWLDTGGYKFVLTDANDVEIFSVDDIDGGSATGYASTVISKSSSFSLTINEQNNVIVCTASLTVSLLPAGYAGDGFAAIIVNTSSGDVTIIPDGSETIQGNSSLVVASGESATLHCDGSNWYASGVSGGVQDGDKGDITVSSGGDTWTIDNDVVTLAKQAGGTANRLQGFDGSGNPSEVTVSTGLDLASAVLTLLRSSSAETLTGTDSEKALTASGFAGNKDLSASGYYKFPAGFVVQWGTYTASSATNGTTTAVTFPTAFDNACVFAHATGNEVGNSQPVFSMSYSYSTTGCTFMSGNTANSSSVDQFAYIAIGY